MFISRFATICFLFICINVKANSFEKLLVHVEMETKVPSWVLKKICVHESQSFYKGKRQAWPWTLNVNGKGIWFKSKSIALSVAEIELLRGGDNIDIGLCQVNWKWHKSNFSSVSELLDPVNNIFYAAKYLTKIKGDKEWKETIGLYHSPSNKKRAKRYMETVLRN